MGKYVTFWMKTDKAIPTSLNYVLLKGMSQYFEYVIETHGNTYTASRNKELLAGNRYANKLYPLFTVREEDILERRSEPNRPKPDGRPLVSMLKNRI